MKLKFPKFERDQNAKENFLNGIKESKTLQNSMKVDEIITSHRLLSLNFIKFCAILYFFVKVCKRPRYFY